MVTRFRPDVKLFRTPVTFMRIALAIAVFLLSFVVPSVAQPEPERSSWFFDIVIPAGQKADSASCIFCCIKVYGELEGDATTQWGDIVVTGVVGKDTTAVGGDIRLGPGAVIHGDSVSVFGDTELASNARIEGEAIASLGAVQKASDAITAETPVSVPIPILSRLPSRVRTTAVLWLFGIVISLPLAFLCLLLLRQQRLEKLVSTVKLRRWRTTFFGFVAFALLVAALAIGGDSQYDDWIELPLTIAMAILAAPGYTALALELGKRYRSGMRMALLVGTVLLVTVQVVPLLGWLLGMILTIMSLGMPLAAIGLRFPEATVTEASRA